MNIFIDGQKVDFVLENEKTLFDLASGIQNWANASHRFIRSVCSGNRVFTQVDDTMKEIGVGSVDDLYVETMTAATLAREAIGDVVIFFGKLKNRTGTKFPAAIDLVETLQWCYNVISKSRIVLGLDYNEPVEGTTVNQLLIKFNDLIDQLKERISSPLTDAAAVIKLTDEKLDIDLWLKLLAGIRDKAERSAEDAKAPDKDEALKKLRFGLGQIPELRGKIESISTLLHTGGDATAMDQLTTLSSSLAAIIQSLQRHLHIIMCLKIKPEFRFHSKEAPQTECCVGGYRAPPVHNFIYAARGHSNIFGQSVLGHPHWL